jgi:hypothetical protein
MAPELDEPGLLTVKLQRECRQPVQRIVLAAPRPEPIGEPEKVFLVDPFSTAARWMILSSRAAPASGRGRPSGFGMYRRRDGCGRYAPLSTRSCRAESRGSRSFSESCHVIPSTPRAASRFNAKNDPAEDRADGVQTRGEPFLLLLPCHLSLPTCRPRASPWVTLARSCARSVRGRPVFPSALRMAVPPRLACDVADRLGRCEFRNFGAQ